MRCEAPKISVSFFISKHGKIQDAGNFLWQQNYLSLKNRHVTAAEVVAQNSGTEGEVAKISGDEVAKIPGDEVAAGMTDPETGAKSEVLTRLFDNL